MPLLSSSVRQLAHFQIEVTAFDKPTDRRRWNGDPMASREASEALRAGVEAFRYALKARGFEIARTGSGVTATEVDRAAP